MTTPPFPHSPHPLPLDVQIARNVDRLAWLSFAIGVAVGAIGASGFWIAAVWNLRR